MNVCFYTGEEVWKIKLYYKDWYIIYGIFLKEPFVQKNSKLENISLLKLKMGKKPLSVEIWLNERSGKENSQYTLESSFNSILQKK